MKTINDIEREGEDIPHNVAEVMCWLCGKRWIAVFPCETLLTQLECPSCRNFGYAFLTGQNVVDDDGGEKNATDRC